MPKLHLPGSKTQVTACGRQLNNQRAQRAQTAVGAIIAPTVAEYLAGLDKGQSCRFCGRAAGLLPKLQKITHNDKEDLDE